MMWMDPAGRPRQLSKELDGGAARDQGSEARPSAAPEFVILLCAYLISI